MADTVTGPTILQQNDNRVVIKTTTLNKFVSFAPKNGSCNQFARSEADFPVEFDKIIHHTIFGDLNIV